MILNGFPVSLFCLVAKKSDMAVAPFVSSGEKIGDNLKAILYSIEFQSDKDMPVTLPPDVHEFFDQLSSDAASHDLARQMRQFSDRYLNSGRGREKQSGFGDR